MKPAYLVMKVENNILDSHPHAVFAFEDSQDAYSFLYDPERRNNGFTYFGATILCEDEVDFKNDEFLLVAWIGNGMSAPLKGFKNNGRPDDEKLSKLQETLPPNIYVSKDHVKIIPKKG